MTPEQIELEKWYKIKPILKDILLLVEKEVAHMRNINTNQQWVWNGKGGLTEVSMLRAISDIMNG